MEEVKFPIDFDSCPNCGSTRKLAEEVMRKEKDKGKVGEEAKPFAFFGQSLMADPRRPFISAPILLTFYDVCADCGTVYCVHAELGTATPQMKPGHGPNKGMGMPFNNPLAS